MADTYTISDISEDLKSLLQLTKLFDADDQGYWIDTGRKERYIHKLEDSDSGKPILVFQDPLPDGDYYLFNPYSEGLGKQSPASALFFRACRTSLNYSIERIVKYIVNQVLHHKQRIETDPEHQLGHVIIRMSSVPIDKKSTLIDVIDEQMITEFDQIFNIFKEDFVFIPYMTAQMTAMVKIDILSDPKFEEKIPKDIRKKSFAAFKAVLMGVLGIKKPEDIHEFSSKYDPKTKSSARMHTTLSVYLNLYSRFNDAIADAYSDDGIPCESEVMDLGRIQEVIERIPLAYAIAKHMVQPVVPRTYATSTTTVDTRGFSSPGGGNGQAIAPSPFEPEVVRPSISIGSMPNIPLSSPFQPEVVRPAFSLPPGGGSLPVNQNQGWGQPSYGGGWGQSMRSPGVSIPINYSGGVNLSPPTNFNDPVIRRY